MDSAHLGVCGCLLQLLRHAEAASESYGVDLRTIVEVGTRGLVGGQEDRIVDMALTLRAHFVTMTPTR
ncbi:hypothetical protein [Nocardioides sp.]|uniref:hypothetical protein n=1 Tax=Nocardioides sp. TaxID=35761 RepID=UPI003D11C1A5